MQCHVTMLERVFSQTVGDSAGLSRQNIGQASNASQLTIDGKRALTKLQHLTSVTPTIVKRQALHVCTMLLHMGVCAEVTTRCSIMSRGGVTVTG